MRWLPWAILALLAGGLWLLWPDAATGDAGSFPVLIEGPDGEIWNGTVQTTDATALRVLQAAASAGNFSIAWDGHGANAFVTSIDGHANEGAGGWCVAVLLDGAWQYPFLGADQITLQDGQASRWSYYQGGCPF